MEVYRLTPTTDSSNLMVEEGLSRTENMPANIHLAKEKQLCFHQSIYQPYRNSAEDNPNLAKTWTLFQQEQVLAGYKAIVVLITEQTAYPIRDPYSSAVWSSQKSQRSLGQWLLAEEPYYEGHTVMARKRAQELESVLCEKNEEAMFIDLAEKWKRETQLHSSMLEIAMHPAYQRIIGMGPFAIPLILNDLGKEINHWFWALRAITGENPVPQEHQGKIEDMASDWLKWGRSKGHEC